MTTQELQTRIEELKKQEEIIGAIWVNEYDGDDDYYYEHYRPISAEIERLEKELEIEKRRNVKVGDGITLNLYSDSHAFTIISRTAKTITIQQDKATLDPNFKPIRIAGGFAGHCINQDEQTYTYERDPNGRKFTLRWSNVSNRWKAPEGYNSATLGRHEFYDYNF